MRQGSTSRNSERLSDKRTRFSVEQIEKMVHQFYGRVRTEPILGPIFEERIGHWPDHLDRMVAFWRAVLRSESTFSMSERGAPPILHRQIEELELAHFDIWLALFAEVVDGIFEPDEATEVKAAARRIAVALSRHLGPASSLARRAP
jgi:hemoglobin